MFLCSGCVSLFSLCRFFSTIGIKTYGGKHMGNMLRVKILSECKRVNERSLEDALGEHCELRSPCNSLNQGKRVRKGY